MVDRPLFATGATLMFDPPSLAPGSYSASVAIASNAADGTVAVAVDSTVVTEEHPHHLPGHR
jgi:hypothetical protein